MMTTTSYDQIPYPSTVFKYTQPYKLATVAKLFGLQVPAIETSRVLGCGIGNNLMAMAQATPKGEFVGIDLSAQQITKGQDNVGQLGFKNIILHQMDVMEVNEQLGMFDYIIAHGIYSWVPAEVQDKILQICHDNLTAHGIAYVSYNTYPGWHTYGMIRQMMLYHTRLFTEPQKRIEQAKVLLRFLVEASGHVTKESPEENFYNLSLKKALNRLREINDDAYLFHEYLEENNEPIFFHQFVERARNHQHDCR